MTRKIEGRGEGEYLTRREAAARAGVHYNSIRAWEKAGVLSSRRATVGGKEEVQVSARDLAQAVESRRSSLSSTAAVGKAELTRQLETARQTIARLEGENQALHSVIERYLERDR